MKFTAVGDAVIQQRIAADQSLPPMREVFALVNQFVVAMPFVF